jgi:hypothetical protein
MIKKSITAGLIAGGILVGFFVLTHMIFMKNFNAEAWEIGEVLGYSSMIIALTAIFFGVKAYRDKVLGGKISFGKAFAMGISISAVAGLIFGIYVYVLYTFISPDLSGRMIEIYREKIRTSGQTQEVITQQLAQFEVEAELWKNTILQSFVMFITVFMIGVLISLVTAAILKRREPLPIT